LVLGIDRTTLTRRLKKYGIGEKASRRPSLPLEV